jgi:ABC-type polysaccharide/polyol phosphate transport system ATPase subunit
MITSPIKTAKNNMQLKAVELSSVSKKYSLSRNLGRSINADFEDFWVLKGVSFEVDKGQILGVVGRNGAGKTTLLNIIAGILSPTEGRVLADGKVLGLFNLGVGFQDELTGRENIFLNGAILGVSKEELSSKLASIIEFSELGDFIDMPLGSYSQGMRLRLGFSIVIHIDFDTLVIDEVLTVGDALFQSKCFERLVDFRRSGKTLIITTQEVGLIERLCDKVALLDHGRLLFYGEPAEGINRYRALLNTEKFFVGPAQKNIDLIENTKKWADDIAGWGRKLGSKEVIIESVEFRNRFGWRSNSVKSGEPLEIKVDFNVKDSVKEPHFGVAIFRNDGVYCYGPNTGFDGYSIPELSPGKGYFILKLNKLLFAPGEYRVSAAIWDKNETLAFDYHDGCYKLNVTGKRDIGNQLLNLTFDRSRVHPDLSFLEDKRERQVEQKDAEIESVEFLNYAGEEKRAFMTNEPARLRIAFAIPSNRDRNNYLWVGLYRDDGIYCQGITRLIGRRKVFEIAFPKLPLLPGGYRVSLGIWDNRKREFVTYRHAVYPFRMAFNRQDHGTVYLGHSWQWRQMR